MCMNSRCSLAKYSPSCNRLCLDAHVYIPVMLLNGKSQTKQAATIAPTLTKPAMRTLTALLSNKSLPTSTFLLSCWGSATALPLAPAFSIVSEALTEAAVCIPLVFAIPSLPSARLLILLRIWPVLERCIELLLCIRTLLPPSPSTIFPE